MVEPAALNFDLGISDHEAHVTQTRRYLIGDVLRKAARTYPSSTAIVGEDGTELSYEVLEDRVNSLANALIQRGVDHTSRLAILSENRPEYVEVVYAGAKIGSMVPTLNWRQEREELLHCLDSVDADVLFASERQRDKYEMVADSELTPEIVFFDGHTEERSYASLLQDGSSTEPSPDREPRPEDGLCVFFTSGTTGLPKGAIVSHRALLYRALGWKLAVGVGPDYVAWPPMSHMGPTERSLTVAIEGGTLYTLDGFQPETLLRVVRESDSGYVSVIPSVINSVVQTADELGFGPGDFEHVDYVGSMADLAGGSKIQDLTRLFEAEFVNTFGATETGAPPLTGDTIPPGVFPTKDDLSKSEGPIGAVKLVDEEWNAVPVGEEGEFAVRGPTLFSGYVGDREENVTDFHDGWFRTGDILVMNGDGTYDFVDRRKYLIKSGGENIYPAEIERTLMDHEQIHESIVVRVPDDDWGEVPKAYVVAEDGADLTGAGILTYLDGRIARYKLPHYVEFVSEDAFPRSTTGKIVRGEVEDWPSSAEQRFRDP